METHPTILLVADEPILIVDMLCELEARGFAVVPMKPDEYQNWPHHDPCPNACNAAILDLHGPDATAQGIALSLRGRAIPIVALGGGLLPHASWSDSVTCLSKPVDYDRLEDLLLDLVGRSSDTAPKPGAGLHDYAPDPDQPRMASQ